MKTTREKKAMYVQKINTEPYLNSRPRAVCTQKWTTLDDFWTPAEEAVCMTSRHPPLLVDVVGLYPLSGMRFLLVSRGATTKKRSSPKNSTSKCAPEHVFGPCALHTGRWALLLGLLQRACV